MNIRKIEFLVIGAQRSATSWLYRTLQTHPQIWLPPKKEIHYFDRSPSYPSPNRLAATYLSDRLFNKAHREQNFFGNFFKGLKLAIRIRDRDLLFWTLRYYLATYDDDWYFSLFSPGKRKIRGEITPAYSILNERDVKHIRDLVPELKIIFMLRNPPQRAWSNIRFKLTRAAFTDIHDLEKIKSFIDSPEQELRSDYLRTINTWSSCFPEEQMFICFYDDLVADPDGFASGIMEFLGADPNLWQRGSENECVNASKSVTMPADIELYLAEKYISQLEILSRIVGKHSIAWLSTANEVLARAQR